MRKPSRRKCKVCGEYFVPKFHDIRIRWCCPEHGAILAMEEREKEKVKAAAKRIAGATMCGILCFFAQPTLTAIWAIFNWNFPPELCWPISAGVGYVGVDSLFAYARRRLGLNEPGDKANADPQ
ncbi:TPA: phage holin family protein [Enterobacter hormaechei subsp. xiangfangensis]|nr:phage holin family protein [Enterobacter hormaechei]ELC6409072.1 phage holin family protein [Enterobacter hormaechei]MBF9269868.1 phage holin family protein [Enterobacter hormaechei]HED1445565.1 phage holin family protein [Enterobacter hormaechei subsp. steigerwaltii]